MQSPHAPPPTRSVNGKPIAHCMTWMRMIQLPGEGWLYDPALSPWLFLHIYSRAEVKTCASPDPHCHHHHFNHMFKQSHMGEHQWFEKEEGVGASLVTLQFPPACHRLSFPWEFTEPCVHVQVNTLTTSGINTVWEGYAAALCGFQGGKKTFSHRSIWRCE